MRPLPKDKDLMTQQSPTDHGNPLRQIIQHTIDERGGIPFGDYMELCLYHPQHGYYMSQRQRVGAKGDFFTSSSVHHLFGGLIARQLHEMWQLLGAEDFTLVEQGAGDGFLALDILDTLAEQFPEMYERTHYVLIDVSEDNRQRQQQNLSVHSDHVTWQAFNDLQPFCGCFLSNELIDAFAVSLFEKHDGHYQEVFVVNGEDGFCEELRPADQDVLNRHFQLVGAALLEGNRGEVCFSAQRWMTDVAEKLQRGFVITIDYGYPAQELYAPFRRQGSLLCYYQHTANDNPYQNVGCQDITSHIDFTLLQRCGEQAGLDVLHFTEQYRFLIGLGFVEQLMALQAQETDPRRAMALRMTLKNLILPDGGMGETFKVLVQGKGVGHPALQCQRKISEISALSV
jgi:SAM-dependent MidA family methyltransferase